MAKMIEGDLRIPKMYNFIFTIIFDFRPKVDGVILPSPLKLIDTFLTKNQKSD